MKNITLKNIDDKIHVFVFCCAEYHYLLDNCIESITNHVSDLILSINIVTNKKINHSKYNVILDRQFWDLLDKDFKYRKLYNHNWIRQQIFKLNVDQYVTGSVLIVDASVLFTGKTQWIENGKINFYTKPQEYYWGNTSTNFMRDILHLEEQIKDSFVVESMIFLTDVLANIREDIRSITKKSWFDAFSDLLLNDNKKSKTYTISEYEIYGNYFCKNYPHLINKFENQSLNNFVMINTEISSNSGQQTRWLTFYEQVREKHWPNCYNEKDFEFLPENIKQECIEVHGYQPNQNTDRK